MLLKHYRSSLVTEMLEDCSDGVIARKSGLQKLIEIKKKFFIVDFGLCVSVGQTHGSCMQMVTQAITTVADYCWSLW